MAILSADLRARLVAAALAAHHNAHAPYSNFRVGAALVADDGRIFAGCNVENASFGLTICAERSSLFQAVAAGATRFAAVVVIADRAVTPCGACRQVLAEFCRSLPVFVASANDPDALTEFELADLLPHQFHLTCP